VVIVIGRLSMPPKLEDEDIGGGIDIEAREAEEDLGLRGEVPTLSQERLGLPFVLCDSREWNFSFGVNTWNSQGVTSSLARPALVLLDGRLWGTDLRACIGTDPGRGTPPGSLLTDVLGGGTSGMEVRSSERVLEKGEGRIAVVKGPSTERWCLGMGAGVYDGKNIKM